MSARQETLRYASAWSACLDLTKPRIVTMVVVTGAIGFLLGAAGDIAPLTLLCALGGIALTAGGSGALNHYFEADVDARMLRTRGRPIPGAAVPPMNALVLGVSLTLIGLALLVSQVNLLTAFLALLTTFLYVVVYTPMKRLSWANTLVGAVPGALPPVGGWTAAAGQLDLGAWVLFAILFLWQMPHFYAIAWMYREDYARGGFRMLPVIQPDGKRTFRQIIFCSALLIPASVLPTAIGLTSPVYAVGAILLGAWFMRAGLALARSADIVDARRLLRASVIYLPVLLLLILIDFAL